MSFRIIRAGEGYGLIVVVSPENAEIDDPTARYWCWRDWTIGDLPKREFVEITQHAAQMYFSGQADGLGWGELPENAFETLREVREWRWEAEIAYYEHKVSQASDAELRAAYQSAIAELRKHGP